MSTSKFDFSSRLEQVKRAARERYLKCIFIHGPHYTEHGEPHCKNIEKHLQKFLHTNPLSMNEYEDFLLKCAIWLHDIGMVCREDEKEDIEKIRKNHHIRSRDLIDSEDGRKIFGFNSFESNVVATVSFLHSKKEDICKEVIRHAIDGILPTKYSEADFTVDIKKLSMLIRLLDTCDRDKTRAYDIDTLTKNAKLPKAAMYHWAHSRINNVRFNEHTIEVHSLVPPPSDGERTSVEEAIIDKLIIAEMGKEINSLDLVLGKYDLWDLNVKQIPHRTATDSAPQAVLKQYRSFINSTKFLSLPGFINRSVEKNVCILKNGHTIVDFTYDILVTEEKGIKEIFPHMFSSDESSVPNFKFRNLEAMKAEPIENRWTNFWFTSRIFRHNLKNNLSFYVEEIDGIESPLKAKYIKLIFSENLKKSSKVKYGIAYSAPRMYDMSNPNKIMTSSLFIPRDTNEISITLKFEKELVGKEFEIRVLDTDDVEKIQKDINTEEPQFMRGESVFFG